MNSVNKHDSHEELSLLLPWYVNGSLESAERSLVAAHLADCRACADAVELLRRMELAARHPDAMPIVPPPRPERLLQRLDRQAARQRYFRRAGIALGVAATLLLGVSVSVQLSTRMGVPEQPTRYQTLTSDGAVQQLEYVVEVGFEPGTGAQRRREILDAMDARLLSDEGDTLRLMLRLPAMSLEQLEAERLRIESTAEIRQARVVAIQLPVQ